MSKRSHTLYISLALLLAASLATPAGAEDTRETPVPGRPPVALSGQKAPFLPSRADSRHQDPIKLVNKSAFCLECHEQQTPGIFEEWVNSTHARVGVGCADCHGSERGNSGAFLHAEKFYIKTVVTPFQCAKCHKGEAVDFSTSGHARSLELLRNMKEDDPRFPVVSLYKEDNFSQCGGCHGVQVKNDENNLPDPATWPASGAGRINPDESHGTCAACHLGHRFSAAAARQPETCLRCHDGANYPEGEIYRHSLHGVGYQTLTDKATLDRPGFFFEARQMVSPSCAFCHMNGSGHGLLTRHNQAWRLPRDLTAPQAPLLPRADNLRANMKAVCNQCHAASVIDRFFTDADKQLQTYQQQVVEPQLAAFTKKLAAAEGEKRQKLLGEYSRFLAESKGFRMNLYMGRHGRSQR